ncbi:hypothetical protein TIFTF001_040684 [Ficus carica]|uniref:Uncharacterized protein n=1 Tax=Ficus carica TaxID=3494 RepID=A0AA87ZFB8_FICCA|nr:hypothetical protein TIFTF001_040684 [Ficus carica]
MRRFGSAPEHDKADQAVANEQRNDDDMLAMAVVAVTNSRRGHVDINADYEFDDGIDGTGPSTRTQQHDSSRGAMNQMRDVIADDM